MAAPIVAHQSPPTGWVVDYGTAAPPQDSDMAGLSSPSNTVLGAELAGAQSALEATAEEILLAALARTIARSVGAGMLGVDVACAWAAPRRVTVQCVPDSYVTAPVLLDDARRALAAGGPAPADVAEVRLAYGVAGPDAGHRLTLQVRRGSDCADALHLDWRYDARSFDRVTIEELSEQFPLALIEVTSG
jgi:hypothetical protein